MADNGSPPPNTKAQIAAHEANEAQAELEKTWDIYQVEMSGDEAVWVPRANPLYWNPIEDEETSQVIGHKPKPAEELPDHASLNENGDVVMTARALVTCRARNEDHAKMLAMRDNPDYHTVENVINLSEAQQKQEQ